MKSSTSLAKGAFVFFMLFQPLAIFAQTTLKLDGAWTREGNGNKEVLLFQDGYATHTRYNLNNKHFDMTHGGSYSMQNKQVSIQYEFSSSNTNEIGKKENYRYTIKGGKLSIAINSKYEDWTRAGSELPLTGTWKITQRMQEGKLEPIHQSGTRKTLKILAGNRFQWIAIDPGKKEFSGTGGGTYSFSNGKYTENIEFFSRDNNRVGTTLAFEGKLENGSWHHSGLSSKGDKIYEVWSRINAQTE